MESFLGFPERFKVYKKLGKTLFLDNASLTAGERQQLHRKMNDISICYDIQYSDRSEMMVLQSEWTLVETGYGYRAVFSAVDYAEKIAVTVPYPCMVLLTSGNRVELFVFEKHRHLRDDRRSVVDKTYYTKELLTGSNMDKLTSRGFLNALRACVDSAENADDLNGRWIEVFKRFYGKSRAGSAAKHAPTSNLEEWEIQRKERRDRRCGQLLEIQEEMAGLSCNWSSWGIDGPLEVLGAHREAQEEISCEEEIALDLWDNMEHKAFLEFCCESSVWLYHKLRWDHATEKWTSEIVWLYYFIGACAEYAKDAIGQDLGEAFNRIVVGYFFAHHDEEEQPEESMFSAEILQRYITRETIEYSDLGDDLWDEDDEEDDDAPCIYGV